MSRPKTAGGYPVHMLDILDRLEARPDIALEMFFPSKAAANSFRLDFYSFRACAIKEGMESMYKDMKAIEVRVSDDGVAVFMHKDKTPEAKIVEDAIERAKKKANEPLTTEELRANPDIKLPTDDKGAVNDSTK